MAKWRAISIYYTVDTCENNFEEARARFNTELVSTSQQIQGQEFQTVVVNLLISQISTPR